MIPGAAPKHHPVAFYAYAGLAFLLWENLISSILGIYALELRRTLWGSVYYITLFLAFGGLAEGLGWLSKWVLPKSCWSRQRYVWLVAVLTLFLWGDLSRQLLMQILDLSSIHKGYLINFGWIPFVIACAVAVNLYLARRERSGTLKNPKAVTTAFSMAALYLIISTKISYRYFPDNPFSLENLSLQPVFLGLAAGMYWLAIHAKRFSPRNIRLAALVLPILLTLVVLLFASTRDFISEAASTPRIPRDRPNFVVMVFDALRADYVDATGGKLSLTPALDSLAAQGRAYPDCYSVTSWTFPAATSLLTGKYPSTLGLLKATALPDTVRTLPEILNQDGYQTVCLSANDYFFTEDYGFNRPFSKFELVRGVGNKQLFLPFHTFFPYPLFLDEVAYQFGFFSTDVLEGDWREMMHQAEGVINHPEGKPLFLYMHFIEPHWPYVAAPYKDNILDLSKIKLYHQKNKFGEIGLNTDTAIDRRADILRARYENGVRAADEAVADMRHLLSKEGLDRSTVILVLADHGEAFMEHGIWGHNHQIYNELTRVPLVVYTPPDLGFELPAQPAGTMSLDIVPTIVDLAGIQGKSGEFDGWSLLQPYPSPVRPRYLAVGEPEVKWRGIVSNPYKLSVITSLKLGWSDTLLFNLESDPGEKHDVFLENKSLADSLAVILHGYVQHDVRSKRAKQRLARQLDPERLKALGYVN